MTEPSGQVKVWICKSHYGHNSDLGSTWLPKFKREEFAARLQQGVPKEKILEDIINSVSSKFQRHHLADKQDLKNIRKAFGLDDVQRHANDQDSVLAWIQEWHDQKENPVVYYKLQGLLNSYSFPISISISTVVRHVVPLSSSDVPYYMCW